MLRSPISPASFCTFVRSSSRNATSSEDSTPTLETFLPGILIPNHQSNTKTAVTATVMRSALKNFFETVAECTGLGGARPAVAPCQIIRSSRELFPEPQSAQTKKQIRHHNKYQEVGPVFEKIGAAQN